MGLNLIVNYKNPVICDDRVQLKNTKKTSEK